jgi:rod shape-determining protein MreC
VTWISSVFARYWRNVHVAVLAALAIVLILRTADLNGLASRAIVGSFYYPFFRIRTAAFEFVGMSDENRRLNRALVEASLKLSQLDEVRRENLRLAEIMDFQPATGYGLIPARVISVTGIRLPVGAMINRGSAEGVKFNQPIINQFGLIGRVANVEAHTAAIQLLSDPTNRVAVRLSQSREGGIVKYDLSRGFMMDNFPTAGTISEGDTVVSSGLGGVFPPGLMVGRVVTIERPIDIPFCHVMIEPMANFNALEEVFVLKEE